VQADSTFALAWYYSAIAAWWDGDFLAAEEEVRSAQRAENRLTARDREGLAALDALIRAKYSEAAAAYRALLNRYPDDKEFAYGLGEALYHQGTDLPGARAAFEQAIDLDPSFGTPYYHLVDIATEEEDFERALGYVRRLQSADPEDPGLYLFRARVQAARGDAQGAIASDRHALAIQPNLPHAWFDIVRLHVFQGQFDSAQTAMGELQKLGDRRGWEDARLAFLVGTGRHREAIRMYRSLPPEEIGTPNQRLAPLRQIYVTALIQTGDVEGAIAEMKSFLADPMMVRALGRGAQADNLADLYIAQGRIADAEKLLREYDRSLVDSPTGHEIKNRTYIEGILVLSKGRPREAIPILERSRPMSPPGQLQAQRGLALTRALVASGDTS
ncbi:MAG TPA: tetratricopeptide repeat protein, partial [Candidatus Eisenbacteria bacterium]|nr:tetratricopeptide repeat protein [Candidatus Eisenbacteria bacterium]